MKYWEKNETDGMIDKRYLYDKTFQRKYTPEIAEGEEFLQRRYHIKIRNLFLMDVPNFTFGGFNI